MDLKIFLHTLGLFYAIGYGIIFAIFIFYSLKGEESISKAKLGCMDLIFFLYALGTSLVSATK